jgi:hypothetical protein
MFISSKEIPPNMVTLITNWEFLNFNLQWCTESVQYSNQQI